ncbi:MAG: hypothetical protein NTX30_04815, partial [Deltaproteobacteria bacterium]|nr:hypothetical protein [Deltaproteobacteria bacterium]
QARLIIWLLGQKWGQGGNMGNFFPPRPGSSFVRPRLCLLFFGLNIAYLRLILHYSSEAERIYSGPAKGQEILTAYSFTRRFS